MRLPQNRYLLIAFLLILFSALPALAATRTVTNCADSTATGTLRWALNGAGANDVIDFAITLANAGYSTGESYSGLVTNEGTSNTWFRIIVNSDLPAISGNNIQIRGFTQTGDVTNPMPIEIRQGDSSTATIGLNVAANYCTIEGLVINGFSVGGNTAIRIAARNYNQILNNYIGTTATGEAAKGNYHGVYIDSGANYNLVKGNLISGNIGFFSAGVYLIGASNNNIVQGNYIGTKKSGTAALANQYGININGSAYNTISGTTEAQRNLISGNTYGICLTNSAASNEVKGNYIGTDFTGTSPVPNSYGVYIESSSHHNIIGNSNLIARNTNAGIQVLSTAIYNTITSNTMEANGGKGILIEAGANEDVPYPVISSATIVAGTTTITGTAQILSSVEVFKTESTPDTSGQGEGKTYLGTVACPDGNWMLTVEGLAIGNKVTATTTTSNDSTSEFAVNVTVAEPPPPNTVINCQDSGPGSLRQCMTDAVFGDTIAFNIPTSDPSYEAIPGGNVWVIRLKSVLPVLDDGGVYLNGSSQKINQGDQNPNGPEIMVSVEATAFVNVLSNNNTIEGLTINYFPSGLYAITIYNSYNTIRGCYLGTDAIGEAAATSANRAIWISGSNNLIGGDTADARNLISGNYSGIFLFNGGGACTGNQIKGNYIGVNRTATASIANSYGVYLNGSNVFGNTIGGTTEAERNVISGNSNTGVYITGTSTNEVIGNYIGLGADGATDLGNVAYGIQVLSAQRLLLKNNVISGNNGYGIELSDGDHCAIIGNKIGTSANGLSAVANSMGGLSLSTADFNIIGGTTEAERNIISGNSSVGLGLIHSASNEVKGNYIGLSANGSALGNNYGIWEAGNWSVDNIIGGSTTFEGNYISSNTQHGIYTEVARTRITNNYIGVGLDRATARGNSKQGILIAETATSVEVSNNLISGNTGAGMYVYGNYTTITGNKIGVAGNGVSPLANSTGIFFITSSYNTLGGSLESERNIISGNSGYGIYLSNSLRNLIKGNYIGLASDGSARMNGNNGIKIESVSSPGIVIGGETTFEANYIGSNNQAGIVCNLLAGSVLIKNNIIGLAPDGISNRKNAQNGISLSNSSSITIESNVISGHDESGIDISVGNYNRVVGNRIGTSRDGSSAVGNATGINLSHANFNVIGGSTEAERNIVSGNSVYGIDFIGSDSGNEVLGNYIGTDFGGENALANAIGIRINGSANSNNLIGGYTTAEGNVISGNTSYGIYINDCGSGNEIKNNRIGLAATREASLPNNGAGIYIGTLSISLAISSCEVRYNGGPGIHAASLPGNYQFVIRNCTIEGNTAYGIRNDTALIIDAQYNNWRTPMGPYDPENNLSAGRWFNPGGDGQSVTDYVDYRYWWGWGSVVPAAPNPFSGTAASSSSINWNWNDNTTREALYYVVDASSKDIKVTSAAGATATTESGLLPYTEYTRSAVAWKMDASSESTSFTVKTLPTEGRPTVEVTYPNGGEKLKGGAIYNITFEAISDIGIKANSASFYFTTGEGWTEIMTGQSTETAYAWTTPIITTTEAKVRVTVLDAADRIGTGESDAFFSIDSTPPTVSVTYPNGGENLRAGKAYNITFNCSDISGVKPDSADFYYTTGESWVKINTTGQPTNAAYSWNTPVIVTTEAKVRVTVQDIFDQTGTGESASYFTIDTTPSIEVTYPNGGQYLKGGAVYNISFSVTSEVGLQPNSANIYYTIGESWIPIAVGQATDAVVPWTTPLISTTEAKVRVTAIDTLGKIGTDESDAFFVIDSIPPVVGVVSPNGGELWRGGTTRNITYTASDNIGLTTAPITLKYSTNNGADFNTIAAGQTNSGTYPWLVPAVNTNEAKASVIAEDLAGNTASDESNAAFTIDTTSPFVVSITPTDGATSIAISIEVVAVFSKEMSREAVQNAFDLSASPGVAGVFDWNAGGTIMTFRPSANLEYNKLYNVNIAQTATDLVGNQLAAVFSSSFTTVSQGDDESPHCVIQVVDRDRVASTLKRGDYISKRPWIRGVITDNLALDSSSVKLYLNDVLLAPVLNIISPQRIEANYQFTTDLEDETLKSHTFKLEAKDGAGNAGVKQISDLKVSSGTVRIIGPVLSYPQTFKPKSGTPAKLAYNLTADADIMIYLFSTSGENVWSAKCLTGGAGGRAGYNEVEFDGRSLTNGTYLGNGIYVFKITSNNRVIGTGYITIFD